MPSREPFAWRTRIRFVDTDATGRIHYSSLFRHFEAAEDEFFRSIGFHYAERRPADLSYPRVHVEADYLGPLRYDDAVTITVSVSKIGTSSYTLEFQVHLEDSGDIAARGLITAVCMSKRLQKAHALPDELRQALQRHAA
jgi:YbgC/YbaW family acyl-CoA thioester hydrolase